MSTVEILVRARALYAEAPSHARPAYHPEPGTRCVVFALGDAGGRMNVDYFPAHDALADAMGGCRSVVEWNAEHTTEEVLAAFDRAIATERERCRTRNDLDGIPVREPARTLSEPVLA